MARPSSQPLPRITREEKYTYAKRQHVDTDNKYVDGLRAVRSKKFSQDRRTRLGQKSSGQYCFLCGRRNHLASQGCRLMVDNKGNQVNVLSSHSTCTECPSTYQPLLELPLATLSYPLCTTLTLLKSQPDTNVMVIIGT